MLCECAFAHVYVLELTSIKTELIYVKHATYRECFGAAKLQKIDKKEEEVVMNMECKCLSKVMETCTNSK